MSDLATRVANTGQLLICSGIEIGRILGSMVEGHSTVSASLPRQLMFLSRLVHVDPVKRYMMLAFSDYKAANAALLKLPSADFECHHRWARLAFSCARPRRRTHAGQRAIKIDMPTVVVALRHNKSVVHGPVPKSPPDLRCQLPIGVVALEARLVDMSLDGRAFLLGDSAIPVCAGTSLRSARVTPQGAEPVVVDIEITHVIPTILPDGKHATRIGCRIRGADDAMEKLVSRFIIEFQ